MWDHESKKELFLQSSYKKEFQTIKHQTTDCTARRHPLAKAIFFCAQLDTSRKVIKRGINASKLEIL